MTLTQLKVLYKKAKNHYYNADCNSTPLMTDAKFDKLEDMIRQADPDWAELGSTGVKVNKKTEVELSHFMPSLNKQYPEAMPKWLAANPASNYLVMEKLDGSSLQVTYKGGKPIQVVTRGDGIKGGDISFLIPNMKLPRIKDERLLILRCEAIISRSAFKRWESKFDNARNMVNGLLNRRDPHPALKDVDIITLGIYGVPLINGLVFAKSQQLPVVPFKPCDAKNLNTEVLINVLAARKQNSDYEIDGLVIAPSTFFMDYKNSDKPKGITAFKVNLDEDSVEAKVEHVIWQISGRGRIVPKIEIAPTKMDGVIVTYCTAHNAQWMNDRSIGPGAVVKLVRSGGVIPKIVEVLKPGRKVVPDIAHKLQGVHYVVSEANSDTERVIAVRRIHKFMTTLGIELLAAKTIARLYDSGMTSIKHYIKNHHLKHKFEHAGLGDKQIENILNELHRVLKAPMKMSQLMVATQIFGVGIGERKLKQIEDHGISMMGLLLMSDQDIEHALKDVSGFSTKTIKLILDGMPKWRKFYEFAAKHLTVDGKLEHKTVIKVKGSLSDQRVSFTGYRSTEDEAWITSKGGEIINFGSKTTILLYKQEGKASTKVDKARSTGIQVLTIEELKAKK